MDAAAETEFDPFSMMGPAMSMGAAAASGDTDAIGGAAMGLGAAGAG